MSKKRRKKRRWRFTRLGIVCLVLCILAVLALAGVTAAKYVQQWKPGHMQADAADFYFTSDLLMPGDTPVYQLSNCVPDTSAIRFSLRNYADELRISEKTVRYTVTCTNGVSGTAGSIETNVTGGGVDEPVELTVPAGSFFDGKATVRVTAVSSPYAETLEAVFELYETLTGVDYTVYDAVDSNTVTLTVTTKGSHGTVNITPPSGALPDRTDVRLTDSGSGCSFNANAYAQYSFVFFKTNPSAVFAKTNFIVG